ncbi:DUF302 domain-containing protein [Leisingera sp. ANG-M7]|uniref:DUF302 domain-containing protein n=1 Tax=Leisingera sp. ANG-M7 TaxID=1577902 RepID=UPI00057C9B94|nr:DUF302 domain-containing protein [Leisingera sp. ANG-M7]KIC37181.1 hypothetical protein RA26_07735 [Leisingera sp. ANG-M7]
MFFKRLTAALLLTAATASAGSITPREGWAVHDTPKPFEQLISDIKTASKAQGLGVVTQAGPTQAAAARGITIPGNRVIGLFNNDFAVKILALSTAAMIEAPVRMYVTENADGTATLSYKLPSHVFAPYADEGGAGLAALAGQLDRRFALIAEQAQK